MIVLCVASSGIAALLLIGGRTAHSMFHIPIQLYDGKTCSIKKGTHLADLMKIVNAIIWDEVPMQDRLCQEAVDMSFRDIRDQPDVPFGGVTVIFGGDFQQILPVVVKGGREQIVSQCFQRSYLWTSVNILTLKTNMRLENTSQEEKDFAQWLVDVGHGKHTNPDGSILLPERMKCGNDVASLINALYPGLATLSQSGRNDQYFLDRTILTARNDDVADLNEAVLQRLQGNELTFHSADSFTKEGGADGEFEYPVEYLNSINLSGMPLAKLKLKIGAPVMILRNIDPAHGLCNGTRAILTRASSRVLEVRILGGEHAGHTAFIPRIKFEPSNGELPFHLCRRQFPVRLAFCMSINKSQGQSVKYLGLDVRTPVFTHGQLYVALSRCTSSNHIKVLFKDGSQQTVTQNVVYPEVLLD